MKIFGESEEEEEDVQLSTRKHNKLTAEDDEPSNTRETVSTPPPSHTHTNLPHPPSTSEMAPPTSTPPKSPPRIKDQPRKPLFKPRGECEDGSLVRGVWAESPDKEDVVMLRLALGRLIDEGAELVGGVNWAYHPHNILSYLAIHEIYVLFVVLDSAHLPSEPRPPQNGDGWTRRTTRQAAPDQRGTTR